MKQFEISKQNEGQRFDKYLGRILSNASMSFVYKMLRKKNFVLNDKKASGNEILKSGDIVKLYISDDTFDKFKADVRESKNNNNSNLKIDFDSKIIYEDEDLILINKPSGILSQKATQNDISINEYLIDYLLKKNEISMESILYYKPSVVNRLDRNTTGIIIAAKNLRTAQVISEALKNRTINKYYQCVVAGKFNKMGKYKAYLQKNSFNNQVIITNNKEHDNCEEIITEYDVLEINEETSRLKVHLITGKSHQIRAHLAYLGFPIIGDPKYGNKTLNLKYKQKNQMLHAYKIDFPELGEKDEFRFSGKSFECNPDFRY